MLSSKSKSNFKSDKPIFKNKVSIVENVFDYNFKNVFIAFRSISNELILLYVNNINEIVLYDLEKFQLLSNNFNSHNEMISFLKHFKDINNKRDIIVSISNIDCDVKLWEIKKSLLSCIYDLGNVYVNGFVHGACFISFNSVIFLCVINYETPNKGDNIKLLNIETEKMFALKNTAQPIRQIETFINNKDILIIVCTPSCIKSYYFNPKLLTLYKEYSEKEKSTHIHFEIFSRKGFQAKIIDSDDKKIIRIWGLDSCDLLYKIDMNKNKNRNIDDIDNYDDICLFNNYLLIYQDNCLKVLDINFLEITNCYKFSNNLEDIISIEHNRYGKCILYKEKNIIGCIFFKINKL